MYGIRSTRPTEDWTRCNVFLAWWRCVLLLALLHTATRAFGFIFIYLILCLNTSQAKCAQLSLYWWRPWDEWKFRVATKPVVEMGNSRVMITQTMATSTIHRSFCVRWNAVLLRFLEFTRRWKIHFSEATRFQWIQEIIITIKWKGFF